MRHRIAVVGAGLSGLATLKELREEGHDAVCYEKRNDIGGVFANEGTYDSVELTVSNYFMAYSDFMPLEDTVRFWTRAEYKNYLDKYAEHFGLREYIKFGFSLESIDEKGDGFELVFSRQDGTTVAGPFDRIAVCTGQFQKPNVPKIPGLESFTGKVMHSSEYTSVDSCPDFHGKRVLCLGMGESAADIVTEIAAVAETSTLSLRRNHVFSARMMGGSRKYPIDVFQTRFWHCLPASKKAESVRAQWRLIRDRHDKNDPRHHLASHILDAPDEPGAVVTKTERIFEAVSGGMKVDTGGIKQIEGCRVVFHSGLEQEFDTIMLCTGFKFELPFLRKKWQFDDIRDCFLQTFHPTLKDRIAFIGFARPHQGGVPLIAELLARYYALICSGKKRLPEDLEGAAARDKEKWEKEFYETPHVFGLVNGLRFNEQVADLIGCRPPQPSLLAPKKYFAYWYRHIWPCQYRLTGPGARREAAEVWMKSPCSEVRANGLSAADKLKLIKKLIMTRSKAALASDDKLKWRPQI